MELLEKIWRPGKDFLGVKYPIISGAMTWISDYALCKAVSDAGSIGSEKRRLITELVASPSASVEE